jgi:hypothetical protein
MVALENTRSGVLAITAEFAEFRGPRRAVRFQPILGVSVGRRGSDFFNRWIEVTFGQAARPSTVYLNDGGWRGWRPILTRSNRKIFSDLKNLVRQPALGDTTTSR